jgi:hypothetical protein
VTTEATFGRRKTRISMGQALLKRIRRELVLQLKGTLLRVNSLHLNLSRKAKMR